MHKSTSLGKAILKYVNGSVRCQVCDIFLDKSGTVKKPTGQFCICCGNRVRTKPRSNKCKLAYAKLESQSVMIKV